MTVASWRDRTASPFTPYKKEAVGARGMVASNHPMASAAGIEMLGRGGNAVDAAIATLFALSVVEPMMVGIFGAGFINLYDAETRAITTIDCYAAAPSAAAPDMYESVSDTWPRYLETVGQKNKVGYLAAGVPGSLKGWSHVEETYGKLDLGTVIQPAIRYASVGFPASPYMIDFIADNEEPLSWFPASRDVFLPGGRRPDPGQPIQMTDYAQTLETIAREGPDALYGGELGELIVKDIEARGGIISIKDLRGYTVLEREPVHGTYRGYDVVSVGPPSAGGIAIVEALNLLERYEVASMGFGTAASVHLLAEVLKIAFADRFEYVGDPDFVEVPTARLTSRDYAEQRRAEIDLERAKEYQAGRRVGESDHTTHVTTADRDGNVVAVTQTIHEAFGSKVTVPGTGVLLNNNMYVFDPHPGQPNSIAPGKRMNSSMSPTIVLKDGRPFIALGTPGGTRIFASVLQAVVNVIDHGMTLQEAVEAPRMWTQGQSLEVEEGIPRAVRDELTGMGHTIEIVPRVGGGMNGVMFDREARVIRGAACWRADGAPVGISGGPARVVGGAMYRV